jgi:hypothetical protein
MRLSPAATVGVLLGLALILPACGGDGHTPTAERATTAQSMGKAGGSAANRQCRDQLGDFLDSMDGLRGKLAVGLSYDAYLDQVRETKAAYGRIPTDRLAIGCLAAVGTPGERALNWYLDAANSWGDCLADVSCSTESVEPKLQHKWALAATLLSSAQRALRGSGRS